MHPLTTFPTLLTFQLISPLLLRLTAGLFILYLGWNRSKKKNKWSIPFYVIAGILLILGLYTQIAAILGILVVKFDFWIDKKPSSINKELMITYTIVVIVLLSLLFTGPGFFGFDLPL